MSRRCPLAGGLWRLPPAARPEHSVGGCSARSLSIMTASAWDLADRCQPPPVQPSPEPLRPRLARDDPASQQHFGAARPRAYDAFQGAPAGFHMLCHALQACDGWGDMAWAHTRCWLEGRIDAALLEQSGASSAVAWVGFMPARQACCCPLRDRSSNACSMASRMTQIRRVLQSHIMLQSRCCSRNAAVTRNVQSSSLDSVLYKGGRPLPTFCARPSPNPGRAAMLDSAAFPDGMQDSEGDSDLCAGHRLTERLSGTPR